MSTAAAQVAVHQRGFSGLIWLPQPTHHRVLTPHSLAQSVQAMRKVAAIWAPGEWAVDTVGTVDTVGSGQPRPLHPHASSAMPTHLRCSIACGSALFRLRVGWRVGHSGNGIGTCGNGSVGLAPVSPEGSTHRTAKQPPDLLVGAPCSCWRGSRATSWRCGRARPWRGGPCCSTCRASWPDAEREARYVQPARSSAARHQPVERGASRRQLRSATMVRSNGGARGHVTFAFLSQPSVTSKPTLRHSRG